MDVTTTWGLDAWLFTAITLFIVWHLGSGAIDVFGHFVDRKYPARKPLAFEDDCISVAHEELIERAREVLDCFDWGYPTNEDPLGQRSLRQTADESRVRGCLEALNKAIT